MMNKPLRLRSARRSHFYGPRRLLGTVLGCAALAILATASVSACSSSTPPTTPPSFSPGGPATPTGSASGTPSPSTPTPSTPAPSAPASSAPPSSAPPASAHASSAPASSAPAAGASPPPSQPPDSFPAEPPGAGGGGTAGFQHVLLLCLGVLAILAGAGGIAYRRRAMRDR